MGSAKAWLDNLEPGAKLLIGVWLIFFLLVGFGINGSSTPYLAEQWSLDKTDDGFVFGLPLSIARKVWGVESAALRELAMVTPRQLRSDDYLVQTPFSLGQLTHDPPFPVINTNVGNGQNMFVVCCTTAPIRHFATLARPGTWGYFLFGKERGLAWQWWFNTFSCFTALFLLLEIVLRGHWKLAAFGAFWFCASAYVVAWSLYPAYFVFFPAMGCVAAYRSIESRVRRTKILCGLLLGWCAAGFAMLLYPALQLPVLYVCLAIFAGLFVRDQLHKPLLENRWTLLALIAAALAAGAILIPFLQSSYEALQQMSNTVYPGKRWGLGGTHLFADVFKGMYNLIAINSPAVSAHLYNQCEAASFYYLFPGVFAAALVSRRSGKDLGWIGWLLMGCVLFLVVYQVFGLPRILARLTLMTRATAQRADVGIGLASIVLCMHAHLRAKSLIADAAPQSWGGKVPVLAAAISGVFFLAHGLVYHQINDPVMVPSLMLLVPSLAAAIVYWMMSGQSRPFCLALGGLVILTSAFFNPLSYSLSRIYESELARQIVRLDNAAAGKSAWLAYGKEHPAIMVRLVGAKVLNGQHWHPQLDIWRRFDPSGQHVGVYNRYAYVLLDYDLNPGQISFESNFPDSLWVKVSPRHPVFKELGVRYVLVMGEQQQTAEKDNLKLAYKSPGGSFSIYELE